jgi:hypothetical protein
LRFYTEKFQDYYERKEKKKNRKVKAKPRDGVVSGVNTAFRAHSTFHTATVTVC